MIATVALCAAVGGFVGGLSFAFGTFFGWALTTVISDLGKPK
jgi:hypothetical protein